MIEAGWALPTFKTWLHLALSEQLLARGHPDPAATVGLSFDELVVR